MRLMGTFLALLTGLLAPRATAQSIDTLEVESRAFGAVRTVYVHLPPAHRYASSAVRMPLVVLLDGQHEWFREPVLNQLRYLQYTHEVPSTITVVVPHADRVRESAMGDVQGTEMPLLTFLAEELPVALERYRPGTHRIVIGHSFTASFALYALARRPEVYHAAIAHTPLHMIASLMPLVLQRIVEDSTRHAMVSVGGRERTKDQYHHDAVQRVFGQPEYLPLPRGLSLVVATSARHNAVPIRTTAELLSRHFLEFSMRDTLAPVDENYRMTGAAPSIDALLRGVDSMQRFRGSIIPWEIADVNGLSSRLEASGYREHAVAVLRRGTELYPEFWQFHQSLARLLAPADTAAAAAHVRRAITLLERHERDQPFFAAAMSALTQFPSSRSDVEMVQSPDKL